MGRAESPLEALGGGAFLPLPWGLGSPAVLGHSRLMTTSPSPHRCPNTAVPLHLCSLLQGHGLLGEGPIWPAAFTPAHLQRPYFQIGRLQRRGLTHLSEAMIQPPPASGWAGPLAAGTTGQSCSSAASPGLREGPSLPTYPCGGPTQNTGGSWASHPHLLGCWAPLELP